MNRLLGLSVCVLLGSMVAFSNSEEADPFQSTSTPTETIPEPPLQPASAPEELPAAPALPEDQASEIPKTVPAEEPLPITAPAEVDFEPAPTNKEAADSKPLMDEPDPFIAPLAEPTSNAGRKPGMTFRPAHTSPKPATDQELTQTEVLPPAQPTFSSRKVTILGQPQASSKPAPEGAPDRDRAAQRIIQERAVELARQRRARLEARRWQGLSPYRPQVVYDSPHPGELKNSMNLTRIPFPSR